MPPIDQSSAPRAGACHECGSALARDQRYCVQCGARRGPLPAQIAALIAVALPARFWPTGPEQAGAAAAEQPAPAAPAGAAAAAAIPAEAEPDFEMAGWLGGLATLSPRVAGVATMALLAFGVLVGSAVSPAEPTGASAPIIVAVSPTPTTPVAAPPAAPAPPARPAATPTAVAPAPQQTVTIVQKAPSAPSGGPTGPAATAPPATTLPPIRHVFLIVLSDQGYNAAFGPSSQAPYLAKTLTKQGELIINYFGVASGELANGIALLSGQGPNPQTAANCPLYNDVTPGTPSADGQVSGDGCVYPRAAATLPDELISAGKTGKAYVEDIGNGPAEQPKTCRHPAIGSADPYNAPRPGDAYVTWRNPYVYFHSILDTPNCATTDVGLDQLANDLKQPATAPAFAYIVPNRCHDGSDQPCAPGQPAGLPAADAFLQTVVPQIEASAAYKDNGMIAITFDQAPQSGPGADSSSCCQQPTYPNMPAGTTGPTGATGPSGPTGPTGAAGTTGGGGGQVGLMLISSFVKPGTVNATDNFNHFSLLRSIEDLFGLQHTGYTNAATLPAFDKSVYNNARPAAH